MAPPETTSFYITLNFVYTAHNVSLTAVIVLYASSIWRRTGVVWRLVDAP